MKLPAPTPTPIQRPAELRLFFMDSSENRGRGFRAANIQAGAA
jgi:hypothetical protein